MGFKVIDGPFGRRQVLRALGAMLVAGPGTPGGAEERRARPPDRDHPIAVDVPIVADDPTAIPVSVSVDHPMVADHLIQRIEVTLPGDPVPDKGVFRFTPRSGRAAIAYEIRSGQGGDLVVTAECSRHGRYEVRQPVRVAPGGCAVPGAGSTGERGGSPAVRLDARGRSGTPVAVWASLKHATHTGLVERNGRFVAERPPYFVERLTTFVGAEPASEFRLTAAASADPRIRFFVRAETKQAVRVVFVNNRGETWEAAARLP